MYAIVKATLLLCLGLVVVSSASSNISGIELQAKNLAQFLVQARALSVASPRNSDCFSYYIPKFNELFDVLEAEYAECDANAAESLSQLQLEAAAKRAEIEGIASAECDSLASCNDEEVINDFLDCYRTGAKEKSTSLIQLSDNASDERNRIERIENDIKIVKVDCTTQADRKYKSAYDVLLNDLNACNAGTQPVPTDAPALNP